jgi:hypothetical protein
MGVERFRTGEEMHAAPPKAPRDGGFDRFVRHCARYRRIAPLVFPRGVFKFRSVEDAQAARAEITTANARRIRALTQPG